MNMSRQGTGQWTAGAGFSALTCGPRKFSEKIALHTQRQAEDTAAFREVMMDITSTRIQAQRLRQARSLASYYGGSLPNVNQISKCHTESQQEHLRAEHGQRDHRPIPPGRPSRRHNDSAPYISSHFSPPSGPSWRRQLSNRTMNEKSQVDQLPVTTLSRTNSDSALHTSLRITYIRDSDPAQVLTARSRQCVPLIEESFQEEGKPIKSQKTPSVLSECDDSGKCIFPSPDLSCSLPTAPSLSTCGSLPDLSSLHLPSAVPEAIDPEPLSHTSVLNSPIIMHHLPSTPVHSAIMTDSLSSSLQASTSYPSLQSSLSNPNLPATLSSHSLVESFSSTSLSLSNSSLQSSLSSQSLQSSLSSSSLSNQSVRSAASQCSYSSGIGGSSSSLSCSPHACGHGMVPRSSLSWRRTQRNPLMMPSGGESYWQQPKQISPNMSPTFCSVTQGMPPDLTKVLRETKSSTYHHSHLPPTGHSMSVCQSSQHCQPEGWDQSRQDARKQCQQQVLHQSNSQCKSHPQHSLHSHHHAPQQQVHEHQQNVHCQYHPTQYQQPLHEQCQRTEQRYQQQSQHYPSQHYTQPLAHQQQYWNPQLHFMPHNQYQQQYPYQNQPEGSPGTFQEQQPFPPSSTVMASQDEANQHNLPSETCIEVQEALRPCMLMKELPKLQSKMPAHDFRKERATHYPKGLHPQRELVQHSEKASAGSLEKKFGLQNEFYVGLHLTPSQTEALSQKLGQLQKVPSDITRVFDSKCLNVAETEVPDVEHLGQPQTQSHSKEGLHSFSSTNVTVPYPWLDDDLPDLPNVIPEFNLEPFALED